MRGRKDTSALYADVGGEDNGLRHLGFNDTELVFHKTSWVETGSYISKKHPPLSMEGEQLKNTNPAMGGVLVSLICAHFCHQIVVGLCIFALEVFHQTATFAYFFDQSTA